MRARKDTSTEADKKAKGRGRRSKEEKKERYAQLLQLRVRRSGASAVAIVVRRENVPLREEVILKDQSELNSSRIPRWCGMKVPTPCESSSKSERRP